MARPYELQALMGPSGAGGLGRGRLERRSWVWLEAPPRAGTSRHLWKGGQPAAPARSEPPKTSQNAGKSTLLDILAARKTVGRLTGTVKVNGAPRGSSFVRLTAYVPQASLGVGLARIVQSNGREPFCSAPKPSQKLRPTPSDNGSQHKLHPTGGLFPADHDSPGDVQAPRRPPPGPGDDPGAEGRAH